MTELSDAIKDYEEEEMKDPEESTEVTDEAVEEMLQKRNKQEDQLLLDMKKLVGLDEEIKQAKDGLEAIQFQVDKYLTETGLDVEKGNFNERRDELGKQYNLLKIDIGQRSVENYAITKNVDPCLGVKVTMKKNRELIVDPVAAIEWVIKKELLTFLILDEEKYASQLDLGTMPDQPGEVDNSPIPKARISLKPFQQEEDNANN